jgi:hypothetical protein
MTARETMRLVAVAIAAFAAGVILALTFVAALGSPP